MRHGRVVDPSLGRDNIPTKKQKGDVLNVECSSCSQINASDGVLPRNRSGIPRRLVRTVVAGVGCNVQEERSADLVDCAKRSAASN